MQAPAVQPGGRLFAPDGRHAAPEAPRALQTYPTTSASGRGVRRQAPQRRTTTGDRIAEARASTGLTHPMHQAHRRRRAPGRAPPPAQDPPAGRPSASKEAGHGKANRPALTRVSCNHESLCHLRVSLVV